MTKGNLWEEQFIYPDDFMNWTADLQIRFQASSYNWE